MTIMMKTITTSIRLTAFGLMAMALTACDQFVFGGVTIDEENNPITQKKVPLSGAEIYYGTEAGQKPVPTTTDKAIPNPDAGGAFANWYTCLVMLKEGHPHGGGMMHGNYVYTKAPWKQEQFAEIHNYKGGIEVEMDRQSVSTMIEQQRGKQGPDYFRVIGGPAKLWGLCLYFYDKNGKLMNDSILSRSDEYQLFFSISDVDAMNRPYEVRDVRYRGGSELPKGEITPIEGVPAESFMGKKDFESRRLMTPQLFTYTYRDTWHYDDMNDGVRELFNIKLLPPLTPRQYLDARNPDDQDCVGLKGHFKFDYPSDGLDEREWPIELSKKSFRRHYFRPTYLLPRFCLAVRVMKCRKGKKALNAIPEGIRALSPTCCAPFYAPNAESEWQEIIRFNLPIKVYASMFDSDPTNVDSHEPYYFNLGREIGLTPDEAFDAATNQIIHSGDGSGGLGYGAWFL